MDVERIPFHARISHPEEEEGIFRRAICSTRVWPGRGRFIGRVNSSDRGTKRARCRRWKTDPPSKLHPWRQSIPQVILRAVDNSSCILSSLSLSKSRLIGRRIRVYPNFERERHSSRVTARHRQNYLNFRGRSPLIISADF